MNPMLFQIMQVLIFLTGMVVFFIVFLDKNKPGAPAQMFLRLGFPVLLMLCGLFAGKITGVKAGVGGFELSFADVKKLAEDTVKGNPALAEQITGRQGPQAVESALTMIRKTQSPADLQKVLSYRVENKNVVFMPKATHSFRTEEIRVEPDILRRDNDAHYDWLLNRPGTGLINGL